MPIAIEPITQPTEPSFRELIAQFDGLPDDFDVLKKELRSIAIAATPEHALVSVRRTLERIFQDVYKRRFLVPSNKLRLAEMIERLNKKKQLPQGIFKKADYIRSVGNVGAHSEDDPSSGSVESVSMVELRSAIGLLATVVEWYVKASQTGELDRPAVVDDDKPSSRIRLAIVPKGLDSFGAGDSKFFLKLLPGPFHDDDLPESIHFWKEAVEKEAPFTVGVLYGRSGCGKSSLVKAGLLPRLADQVKRVYVEATADETEKDLLERLQKQFPKLPQDVDLGEAIKALRWRPAAGSKEKALLEGRQKVFIVIDQFEQWLHARRGEKETELVRALRQCDGDRVQVLVSVRDDFWEATSEFMEAMDQPLKDGQNCKRVALFEQDHARQVLAAYGRAYDRLGEDLTPEQESFLDEVIQGLSQDHRVICVRLALFAQMFHAKKWDLEALKAVGGIEGIGSTFLEETFNSTSSDTEKYRKHKDGAISILKALLPEEGAEIKGRKRSTAELMEAAGYQGRPREFARLLGYLDSDLRLISLTTRDTTGTASGAGEEQAGPALAASYYQLTHDYLVPSLRKWLTSKLQETRRGRAGLLLNARASNWKNSRHDDRHIPTVREYLVIRAFTRPSEWTDDQRLVMHHARNVHMGKMLALLVALPVLGFLGVYFWGARHAEDMVGTLLSADIREVPGAIQKLSGYHRWADPILLAYRTAKPEPSPTPEESARAEQRKLRAALALLPVDRSQLDYLRGRLLNDDDIEAFPILCQRLFDYRDELVDPLWQVLEDTSKISSSRFRAAMALAGFAQPDDAAAASRWARSSPFVADEMIKAMVKDPTEIKTIRDMLLPARHHLVGPLSSAFLDPGQSHHTLCATILAKYAADQPKVLAALVVGAREPDAFKPVFDSLSAAGGQAGGLLEALLDASPSRGATLEAIAARKANAAVALYELGRPDRLWPLLRPAQDPRLRSYIIDRLSQMNADPVPIVDRLERLAAETDDGTGQAMILALGEFKVRMQEGDFNRWVPESAQGYILLRLETDYRDAPDPGVRGAAEWLLRTWGRGDSLIRIDESLKRADPERHRDPKGRRWFVNAEGQTMVVLPKAGSFKIGSRKDEPVDNNGTREPQRDVTIDYSFAIGAHEVTLEEFKRSNPPDYKGAEQFLKPKGSLEPRCPVNNVTWYEAAAYCNWLSERDGIPKDQWCYQPNTKSKYASGMRTSEKFSSLAGYRLPTEAEWEYACRAGTVTSRYYGEADELLAKYAWFGGNSHKMLWPVGSLEPNAWGLFDTLGNALEWCQDAYHASPAVNPSADLEVTDTQIRAMRGEKMLSLKENIRAARRDIQKPPNKRDHICGFRVARTYLP